MARKWTEEQKKAAAERLAAARAKKAELKKLREEGEAATPAPEPTDHGAQDPGIAELTAMVKELQAKLQEKEQQNPSQDLAAALQTLAGGNSGVQVDRGRVTGTVERFNTDLAAYPDPRERLRQEPRLKRISFDTYYELDFNVAVTRYETKDGIHYKEPKFTLQLIQKVLDDEGEETNQRIGKAQMVFFEDPDTALAVAEQNGLPIDHDNQAAFLNEMRYLRMRDWLLECFWPPKANTDKGNLRDMVVDGRVVQVWEVSSENGSKIPFDKLARKL